jgi:hypothetical protein
MGLLRIDYFLEYLHKYKNTQIVCLEEKAYIDVNYKTVDSRKTAYSSYRKKVFESELACDIKNIVRETFKLSREEADNYKKVYNEKIKNEQNNLKAIYDVDGFINKAESLIINHNFVESILGFAALTGRRVAEIGCTAEFLICSSQQLFFKGQLKTKESKNIDEYYSIPCLSNVENLLECFKNFRNSTVKYINKPELFHNNCSKDLSIYVKKHFNPFIEGNVTPKDLRAIYATIACKSFKNNDRQTDQSYIADILGHSENDLNTCNSYFDFVILDKERL